MEIGPESRRGRVLIRLEILGELDWILVLGVNGALDLAQAVGASLLPALVGTPAEITSAREDSVWVEAGILVERHEVRGVVVAEDMATMATVMSAGEEAKGRAASWRVTARGCRISLERGMLAKEFQKGERVNV